MWYHIPRTRYQRMVREELQRVAQKGRNSTHKKHYDECLSSSAQTGARAGGGITGGPSASMADNPQVQPLPGLVEGGSVDPGAAAGAADPAAAAAIAVQDVAIYSHLTRSRLSSALAMPRRTTAVARHTIADASWALRPVRCRCASRLAWATFFFLLSAGVSFLFFSNFPSRD